MSRCLHALLLWLLLLTSVALDIKADIEDEADATLIVVEVYRVDDAAVRDEVVLVRGKAGRGGIAKAPWDETATVHGEAAEAGVAEAAGDEVVTVCGKVDRGGLAGPPKDGDVLVLR